MAVAGEAAAQQTPSRAVRRSDEELDRCGTLLQCLTVTLTLILGLKAALISHAHRPSHHQASSFTKKQDSFKFVCDI